MLFVKESFLCFALFCVGFIWLESVVILLGVGVGIIKNQEASPLVRYRVQLLETLFK